MKTMAITLCAVTVALPVYAQPIEQSVSVRIGLESQSVSMVDVVIANNSDKAICYEMGHGPRAFELTRRGKKIPVSSTIPFISMKDYCLPIADGQTHTAQYDLRRAFPSIKSGDKLCFKARVSLQDVEKASSIQIIDCVVIE